MSEIQENIIIANFSIHSLALICWAKQHLKNNFCVLSVDTGFASYDWHNYLHKVFIWLDELKIDTYHLKSENTFQDLVDARKQFPSQQFSWCAEFLKGITLLDKIDELDPNLEATIMLSHRKDLSKSSFFLKDLKEEEKYDYRKLKYPLLEKTIDEVQYLTRNLPFETVFRSCECQPCVHFAKKEYESIATQDRQKVIELEQKNQTFMFGNRSFENLESEFFSENNIMLELSKACSWEYGCGL